ncbi:hypothetical protein NL54_11175 [Pantoea stewartii]|nr:hypothetical protein NL54_11175 [Pantoea stewartii]KHN61282.1 hypothetical protein OI73_17905 [Pantoea stewartii]NRH25002.1 hypothetical protein [Pantoea stewartii]
MTFRLASEPSFLRLNMLFVSDPFAFFLLRDLAGICESFQIGFNCKIYPVFCLTHTGSVNHFDLAQCSYA